jgi:ATP-dependent Clp protease adaptor protein ClpS
MTNTQTQKKTSTGVKNQSAPATAPTSQVVLLNDEDHTYNYVVEMLMVCVGMPKSKAFQCTLEVDTVGRSIVFVGSHDECEKKAKKINTYGADHRMPRSMNSMRAIVE